MRKSYWILSAACASALASSSVRATVTVDGTKDADYGTALALQTVTTGFGDNDENSGASNDGSELDGAYAVVQNGFLNLLFTGNFQSNGNHLNIFFADGSAGQNTLNTGSVGNNLTPMNGSKFSPGFAATYVVDINDSGGTVYVNTNKLTSSSITSAFPGSFVANSGTSTTLGGMNFSLNNTNTAGVIGGTVGPADQNAAAAVSTGMEIAIPLSTFNTSSGTISILADINGSNNGYLSNQFLTGLGTMSGNLGPATSFDLSGTTNQFFTIALPSTGSVNGVWNNTTGGSWNTAANWTGGVPQLAGSRATFGSKIAAASTVTLDGSKTVGQITFNNAASYTIAQGSGGTLTIDDTGDSLGVNPLISVQLGSHTISAPLSVANGVTINTVEATALAVTGTLSGSGAILHSGPGTLKLAGTNNFTGALNSTSGTLELDSNGGASTATITLGDSNVDNQPAALNIGTTAASITNAIVTNRDLAGNNNLRTISSSGNATLSGGITLNGGVVLAPAASTTLTVNGTIQNGADNTLVNAHYDVRASGAGTVVLTQNETNTGDAFVDSGTLVLASTASLQSGSVSVLAGGNFIANGTLSSNLKVYSAGNVQFHGNTSTTAALAMSVGTIEIAANGSVSIAQSASAKFPTVLTTGTLSFLDDQSGKIDLKNNTLITTYDQPTTEALLKTKNILTSSTGGTLGYKDTGTGQTQVQFTKAGDATLDGTVNIADLGILATNYGQSGKFWSQGDFNYDGVVNIADLGLLATNYGTGITSPLPLSFQQALAQVEAQTGVQLPEPSIGLIGMGMLFGARRRRA